MEPQNTAAAPTSTVATMLLCPITVISRMLNVVTKVEDVRLNLVCILGTVVLFILSEPASAQGTFNGYPCTVDCSGHEAGYEWAQKKGLTSADECGGNSNSFMEGCRSLFEQEGESQETSASDSEDEDGDEDED